MKKLLKIWITGIISCLVYTTGNAQNSREEKVLENIRSFVLTNSPDSLWRLCSDSMKKQFSLSDIKQLVKRINELAGTSKEKNFKVFENPAFTSSQSTISGDQITERKSFRYVYMPPYFGERTDDLFITKIGSVITLDLNKENKEWKIENLEIKDNYSEPDYNYYAYFKSLLQGKDSCHVSFRIQKPGKYFVGYSSGLNENALLLSAFKKINYLKEDDFQPVKNPTTPLYSFAVFKKTWIPGSLWSDTESLMILEMVFLDDNSNICLISNGKSYAFYRMGDFIQIKNYIRNELKSAAL